VTADLVQLIGFAAGSLTTFAYVPQVVRTWRTRSTKDLSLGMLVALCAGVSLWLTYGIALGAWPIIIANSVTVVLSLVLIVFKLIC
jgi:MtN3 and saliva related transmembrane protein